MSDGCIPNHDSFQAQSYMKIWWSRCFQIHLLLHILFHIHCRFATFQCGQPSLSSILLRCVDQAGFMLGRREELGHSGLYHEGSGFGRQQATVRMDVIIAFLAEYCWRGEEGGVDMMTECPQIDARPYGGC